LFGSCDQLAISAAEIAVLSSWGLTLQHYAVIMLLGPVSAEILYLSLGFFILRQQGASWLGLTVSFVLVVIPVSMYSGSDIGTLHPNLFVPGLLTSFIGTISMICFLYLMPNGRFSPRWAYIPMICTIVLMFLLELNQLVFTLPDWVMSFVNPMILGFAALGAGLQIYRYVIDANSIDIILNRSLVYGGLTLMVVLLYALVVGGLGLLFQGSGNFVISLVATGLIAVAFQPVRERLQGSVNRLMFGQRDDPYAVLSHLSQQLQTTAVPSETLTMIVQTLANTLKLPYAAIELIDQDAQVGQAFVGLPVGETVELPLHYQKETVGRLLVSPRAAHETFTAQEAQLLADIAAQTAPVASATRLTLALQRSREKLVLTREEERRRIRRDLHDGFGPTMAIHTLKLDTVLELLLADDPQTAVKYVEQLKGQTRQMVTDIRRLVYELYPSVLDELGLLEALRIHVAQMQGVQGKLTVMIAASPDPLPPLPAAIEVAAYRIVLEAVTNVARHARATRCDIWLVVANGSFGKLRTGSFDKLNFDEPLSASCLQLTITDNGVGLPANFQRGVGLTSMRERAEELGGRCDIDAHEGGGTRITAVLPLATGEQR